MLVYAVIVFAIAAVGGLIMAASVLRGLFAPWALSLIHAALGATGLVLVLLAVVHGAKGMAPIALAILVVAALGGFLLASFHLRKQPGPKAVVVIHAGVAVIGFLLLAGTAFELV
ncbi:MAG: hypothetical protein ACTHJR_18880 [Sphingomonas sp.]|uniref:hypothetical protein n=1 Tax=Sphingomonas sp. TaxID=28214 RepID=UPI003F7D0A6F